MRRRLGRRDRSPLARPAQLSRLHRRGGGTTLPGKLLWKLDPGAIDAARGAAAARRGARLGDERQDDDDGDGRGDPRRRPARSRGTASGANLVSGVASTLLAARDAELGLLEVDEGALPEVVRRVRPRASCSATSSATSSTATASWSSSPSAGERPRRSCRPRRCSSSTRDDPQVGDLARGRAGRLAFGLDDPRRARPSLQHAADSKFCVRCGTPYEYAAAYVGHLGDYRCPRAATRRPQLDVAAREIELDGLDGLASTLDTPEGATRVELPVPGLYNVYNALGAASLAHALGATAGRDRARAARASAPRSAASSGSRPATGDRRAADQEPGRRQRGRADAASTAGAAPARAVALNDAIADGRDVSWIWDVDFEPLLAGLERVVATGDRAAELALRCAYGGCAEERDRASTPTSSRALDRGLELTPAGGSSSSSPPTPRCSSCSAS